MANPEKDEKDLDLGNGNAAADATDMSTEVIGINAHDVLWIDAIGDGSGAGGADAGDWTQGAAGHADAQRQMDQWIAADDPSAGDNVLFEDGLALTSIDGLPW